MTSPSRIRRWLYAATGAVLTVGLLPMTATDAVATAAPPPVAARAAILPTTTISLTFDDGIADQAAAVSAMAARGMKGTFFINSGFIGGDGFFTLAQLQSIAAAGNEIGGHTVNHPDLTTLSTDEATRQVCNNRVALTNWGFTVTSFAYPFASSSPATEAIVKGCGYNSARGLGDLRTRFGCARCPYASPVPPVDPFETAALDQVDNTWTLKDLQDSVTRAERTGGWVQFTFHHICANNCDPLSVSPTVFGQFLNWLAPRTLINTRVRTVAQVIGGPVAAAVPGPVAPAAAPGVNAVVNPGLETASSTTPADCFSIGGYGSNTAAFTAASPAHGGSSAVRTTVTNYQSGDAKLLPTLDLGACAPTVVSGHQYSLRTWYTSTAVTQFAVYLRDSGDVWRYWTSSPWFAPADSFTQAVWVTPPIPDGMTGLSFGLNIFANGNIVTDDYGMYDQAGAPAAKVAAVQAPKTAPAVKGPVEIVAEESMGAGG
ncbi:polysaccharide deacetylase [Nakamurella silvestris]|nr:polysaccharide deacetylase [Nakamurella silvestris]